MVRRHESTDAEWQALEPLLPRRTMGTPPGLPNGIVFEFRFRVAWRDVPERYRSWRSLHTRSVSVVVHGLSETAGGRRIG